MGWHRVFFLYKYLPKFLQVDWKVRILGQARPASSKHGGGVLSSYSFCSLLLRKESARAKIRRMSRKKIVVVVKGEWIKDGSLKDGFKRVVELRVFREGSLETSREEGG